MPKVDFDKPVEVKDLPQFMDKFVDSLAAGPYNDLMRELGQGPLKKQIQNQFDREQAPDGSAWQPWHYRRLSTSADHKTLQASGDMMRSFLGEGSGHVESFGSHDLEWGSDIAYAEIHDTGATITVGVWLFGKAGGVIRPGDQLNIPERPIVGWSEKTLDDCADMISEHIVSNIF